MTEQPQFRVVRRGYDPVEVDAWVFELGRALEIERRTAAERTTELTRAQESESSMRTRLDDALARLTSAGFDGASSSRYADVGPRVTSILSLAVQQAEQIRADGERYSAELRESAESERRLLVSQRGATLAATEQDAAAIVSEATEAARRITDAAQVETAAQLDHARATLAQATEQQQRVTRQLGAVVALLDRLDATISEPIGPGDPDAYGPDAHDPGPGDPDPGSGGPHMTSGDDSGTDDLAAGDFYPEFAIVRRGYDPDQVENVLDELYSSLDAAVREGDRRGRALAELSHEHAATAAALLEAQQRLNEADGATREVPPATYADLGTHVTQILDEAASEAAEIRARAERDASLLLAAARADAERTTAQIRGLLDAANRTRVELRRELADVKARIVEVLEDPGPLGTLTPSEPRPEPRVGGPYPSVDVDGEPDQTKVPSVSDHSPSP